jgi:hypothetical protein
MTLTYFQQPQVIGPVSPEQPKGGANLKDVDQRRVDDRKSLEAAVSEGWPVPQPSARVASVKPQRPYRTGAQTWIRRRTIKVQP